MGELLLDQIVTIRRERATDYRVGQRSAERILGAYYTGDETTAFMSEWALRGHGDRVLEPCFGDGSFLRAIHQAARKKGLRRVTLLGSELVGEVYENAVSVGLIDRRNAWHCDFLSLAPCDADAVIGNPPYVRLRHLTPAQAKRAIMASKRSLGRDMDPSGSVWMPFVLHAMTHLRMNGRLAFVLPYEMTHVRYARPLWAKLAASFASLSVIRVYERLFPEILQDVVLLLADGYGGSTDHVNFYPLEGKADLRDVAHRQPKSLAIKDIVRGDKVFTKALLPEDVRRFLDEELLTFTRPLGDLCAFNIGYVSGHKAFFNPSPETVKRFRLRESSLRPAVTSSRQLAGCGVRTSRIDVRHEKLFYPASPNRLLSSEKEYLRYGEQQGVHERYKCRVRDPWFVVPDVRVPDLILPVFAEHPTLVLNDARLVASNSLLCGFLRRGTAASLCAFWNTSLTQLQCETEIHALGGGVFVAVPGEVARIRVPSMTVRGQRTLRDIDAHLMCHGADSAVWAGDEELLRKLCSITPARIDDLRNACQTLRRWRTRATPHLSRA